MPILTFKVNGLTKFEIDIFDVLIAQRALFHLLSPRFPFRLYSARFARLICEAYTTEVKKSQEKKSKKPFFLYFR